MRNDSLTAAWERIREETEALGELIRRRSSTFDLERTADVAGRRLRFAGRAAGDTVASAGRRTVEAVRERGPRTVQAIRKHGPKAVEAVRERGPRVRRAFGGAAHRVRAEVEEQAPKAREALALGRRRASEATHEGAIRVAEAARSTQEAAGRLAHAISEIELPRKERSMFDRVFNRFTVGFATGYVLGARAGRERYEQIVAAWNSFIGNPTVRQAAERGKELVTEAARSAARDGGGRGAVSTIAEVMTASPQTVATDSTLAEAARRMREVDAGAMVVVNHEEQVVGILTDRDIAVRAIAEGKDPNSTKVSEVVTEDLVAVAPTDPIDRAVRLMRDRAIRRLPVVESGRPVGIVSIGDLAEERDPSSALADISRATPPRE